MEFYCVKVYIMLSLIAESSGYCLYGDGPDCVFPCHCANKTECTTGCQPTGCATGPLDIPWQGPGCQIGNAALGKAANQTGPSFPGWVASNGVDGLLPQNTDGEPAVCAHPAVPEGQQAEWGVDLGGIYKISSVIIYNRLSSNCEPKTCRDRTTMFTIGIRNSSNYEELCYDDNSTSQPNYKISLTCNKPVIGRYIRFARKQGGYQSHVMNFCEFIAIGHQYHDCSVIPCEAGALCDEVTGCARCFGSYQPYCHTACSAGFYGTNCQSTCGHCDAYDVCDKTTGHCPNGCDQWWAGQQCHDNIVAAEYHNETSSVSSTQSSSIQVIWQPLPTVTPGLSQFYGYTVYYRQSTTTEYTQGPDVPHTITPQVTITGLIYNTEYQIVIRPYREMMGQREYGNPYPVINQKTNCAVPEKPALLSVVTEPGSADGFFNIKLTLDPAMQLNAMCDAITKSLVQYRRHTDATYTEVTIELDITSFILTDIPQGDYDIKVSVFNNQDVSSSSDIHTVQLGEGPQGVKNLAVIIGSSVAAGVVVLAIILTAVLVVKRRQSAVTHKQQTVLPTQDQQLPMNDASINEPGTSDLVPLDDVFYDTIWGAPGQENPGVQLDDEGYTHLKK